MAISTTPACTLSISSVCLHHRRQRDAEASDSSIIQFMISNTLNLVLIPSSRYKTLAPALSKQHQRLKRMSKLTRVHYSKSSSNQALPYSMSPTTLLM
ncbi:uncharacterized protein PHALS_14730 [Plasmopara halstedii]|uniref:Uncharacterized protein n=1 Tax=Plasmopara halstedii TaxID=4781 RepID=A0A0N7L383_PLAHL|nr:uncharacterized protein PHALS_14730 [Plasmopara halstedii]CEG35155.1 hypothetical protein PHALS_14730 [Plasmopara halstedii]|eukprot:XP_024571524.1 hypothetical protein PHALS_14730 [Plasmopara halstedii]